jgi:Family of unknown function (DUF6325)
VTLGPLDVLVIECPGETLNDDVIAALASAVDSGSLRIIDVVFVHKDGSGLLATYELAELAESDLITYDFIDETRGLLSVDDVDKIAQRISSGASAILMVIEHAWTVRLEQSVLAAECRIVLHERVPPDIALAALDNGDRPRKARREADDPCSDAF